MVERLHKNRYKTSNNEIYKYKIYCQSKFNSDDPDTKNWLQLISLIPHISTGYKIYNDLLENRDFIVVKIGSHGMIKEYDIGLTLETLRLPTYMKFDYLFDCFNCLHDFRGLNSETKSLCKKTGTPINVIVMPYINGWSIDKFKWQYEDLDIIKNISKHIVLSLLLASIRINFVHNDLHRGNILLERTTCKVVSYGEFGDLEIKGYLPIITDYNLSFIADSLSDKRKELVYKDISLGISIIFNSSDINIDYIQFGVLLNLLVTLKEVTKEISDRICQSIDELNVFRT